MDRTLAKVSNFFINCSLALLAGAVIFMAIVGFVFAVGEAIQDTITAGGDVSGIVMIFKIPSFLITLAMLLLVYSVVFYVLSVWSKVYSVKRQVKIQELREKAIQEVTQRVVNELKPIEVDHYIDLTTLKNKKSHTHQRRRK